MQENRAPIWWQSPVATLRSSDLFRRETPAESGVEAIYGWESRRIPYNLIVGSVGIITCIVVVTIAAAAEIFFHSDFGLPDPPIFAIFGVILYAIMANVCSQRAGSRSSSIVGSLHAKQIDSPPTAFSTALFSRCC